VFVTRPASSNRRRCMEVTRIGVAFRFRASSIYALSRSVYVVNGSACPEPPSDRCARTG
jgi:hypothetical protein